MSIMSAGGLMAGATLGSAALGYLGNQQTNKANQQIANTPSTNANSSQSQSSFTPNPMANPMYGYLGGIGQQMGQTPQPYFPGQGYIGPSAPTQAGVNMGMSSLPYYGQGAGQMGMAGDLYGQAAGNLQGTGQYFQDAAGMGGGAAGQYGLASGIGNMGLPLYGMAAMQGLGAQGGQRGVLGIGNQNYGQLSNAADVANNPWVQNQLRANERSVNKNFMENTLPQIEGRSAKAGMLGSSADSLRQGQALGDAAGNLANTNASTMLNAYGQGLGAQTSALGMTGSMLQNQMAPAQSTAWAAAQGNAAMNQAGQAANYLGQGMNSLGQAGAYAQQGAMTPALMAGLMGQGGAAYEQAGDMMNRGGQVASGYGQQVEGYQNAALEDAMNRFNYQYQEPWNRANNISGILSQLRPLGVQNDNSAGTGSNSGQVSPYQSPWMGAGQGAMSGAMMGYGLNQMFGSKPTTNNWLGSGTPQQQVGRYNTGMMAGSPFYPNPYGGVR